MTKTFEVTDPSPSKLRVGDLVTFTHLNENMGEVTATVTRSNNKLTVAGHWVLDIRPTKVVRKLRLPEEDGFYTPAHEGDPVTSFRVFSLIKGVWRELTYPEEENTEANMWKYLNRVAKGEAELNRLVWGKL